MLDSLFNVLLLHCRESRYTPRWKLLMRTLYIHVLGTKTQKALNSKHASQVATIHDLVCS